RTLDETGENYARRIVDASRRIDDLIGDLLDYSRLSRSEIKAEQVNPRDVISDVLERLEEEIDEREAVVGVEGELPGVSCSRTVLLQVMENLLANSLRFTDQGVKPRVRIWAEEVDGWVRLWVEDNGIGISPRYQDRIFRIFERLHGVEAYPGTGVGLAVVRKGMERMGGRVGVISDEGEGSRFWIELPAGRRKT
ncbi:MAG: sensor histidine kinase, partial [Actinomycetota bacterium]